MVREHIKSQKIAISLELYGWGETNLQVTHRKEDAKILGINRLKWGSISRMPSENLANVSRNFF